jgi:hypothetical protein
MGCFLFLGKEEIIETGIIKSARKEADEIEIKSIQGSTNTQSHSMVCSHLVADFTHCAAHDTAPPLPALIQIGP